MASASIPEIVLVTSPAPLSNLSSEINDEMEKLNKLDSPMNVQQQWHGGNHSNDDSLLTPHLHSNAMLQMRRSSSVPNVHLAVTSDALRHQREQCDSKSQIWLQRLKINNYEHSENLFSTLSFLYALFVMVVGIVFPIAEMFGFDADLQVGSFEGFYIYLFVVSILFLIYVQCYVVQSDETLFNKFSRRVMSLLPLRHKDITPRACRMSSFSSHAHTGSFYLRLGAVGFGIGGMILDGLQFGSFFERELKSDCVKVAEIVRPVTQLIFTFLQMYFIFRNSKVAIHSSRTISRFGLMHIVATNLCIWFRVITMETIHELHDFLPGAEHHHDDSEHGDTGVHHVADTSGNLESSPHHSIHRRSSGSVGRVGLQTNGTFHHSLGNTTSAVSLLAVGNTSVTAGHLAAHSNAGVNCGHVNVMSQAVSAVTPYLYACTIEYSLIAAGVVYLIWRNIGRPNSHHGHHSQSDYHHDNHSSSHHHRHAPPPPSKAVQRVSFDCSRSTRGLFVGIFMLIATIISIIVFFALVNQPAVRDTSVIVMYVTELVLYVMSAVAVIGAAHGVRALRFHKSLDNFLDEILLLVALIGVYVFCIFSAICGCYRLDVQLGVLVTVTSFIVMLQATIQTLFILNGLRRSAANSLQETSMPGREYITFLIVSNASLWTVNAFEVLRSDSNPIAMDFFGQLPWSLITHVSVPLAIFYRFHSTVCLVDIWKDAYKPKER